MEMLINCQEGVELIVEMEKYNKVLIQNLASEAKNKITEKIKKVKYYSVILDYTPGIINHDRNVNLVLLFVDISESPIKVKEYFLQFLNVDETNELGLFGNLNDALVNLNLDIGDLRGQGYDNGFHMRGKKEGVQKRMLELNPRAFYTPCGCHNLNLVLSDAANCANKSYNFFGPVIRIYELFSSPTEHWAILEENVKGLALKPSSEKRLESKFENIELLRFHSSQMRDALIDLCENKKMDLISRSSADSVLDDFDTFQFLLSVVIWYNMLFVVDKSSKIIQSEDNQIDAEIKELKGLITYFERFKEVGFDEALKDATEMAKEIRIEPKIPPKRVVKRKNQFDDEIDKDPNLSPLESFKLDFFLDIVDKAISSFKSRLELFQIFEKNFGFLFDLEKSCSNDECLKNHCMNLEEILKHKGISDINWESLLVELKRLSVELPEEVKRPIEMLNYLQNVESFYPNSWIAYRVVLTVPITFACEERVNDLISIEIDCDKIDKFVWEMENCDSD